MEPQEAAQPGVEQPIAQWEQPARSGGVMAKRGGLSQLWIAGIVVAALLIAVAVWQKEWNLGLAGLAVLVALGTLQTQHRSAALPVTVTSARIIVGKREYPLSGLAGFWLDDEGDVVEVNLENTKPGLLPTTFLYATPSKDEARATLSQVLPELEPREKKLADNLNKFIKL